MLAHIKRNFQLTLPSVIRKHLGLREGDVVDVALQGGQIVLTPKRVVDRDEADAVAAAERDASRVP